MAPSWITKQSKTMYEPILASMLVSVCFFVLTIKK